MLGVINRSRRRVLYTENIIRMANDMVDDYMQGEFDVVSGGEEVGGDY